jgi:hypothetical protein
MQAVLARFMVSGDTQAAASATLTRAIDQRLPDTGEYRFGGVVAAEPVPCPGCRGVGRCSCRLQGRLDFGETL